MDRIVRNRLRQMGRSSLFLFAVSVVSLAVGGDQGAWAESREENLCAKNYLSSVKFSGFDSVTSNVDFCAVTASSVPLLIKNLISSMGVIHRDVARTLGFPAKALYRPGVSVLFSRHPSGSMRSTAFANGEAIQMTAFEDWDLKSWSSKIYAHELIHLLSYRPTPLSTVLAGLEAHPFISEAFPDLVSLVVHNDPVFTIEDAGLPGCLRVMRDLSPLRSLNESRGVFDSGAHVARLRTCCASLSPRDLTAQARALCAEADYESPAEEEAHFELLRSMGIEVWKRTPHDLAAPFDPKDCLRKVKGVWTLEGCGLHEFALPLTSFFFTLERELGRPLIVEFLAAARDELTSAQRFECRYVFGAATGTVPAVFTKRSFSEILKRMGAGLSPGEKKAFDQAWGDHGFRHLAEIDRLYSEETRQLRELFVVGKANPKYAGNNGGLSPYTRQDACATRCVSVNHD